MMDQVATLRPSWKTTEAYMTLVVGLLLAIGLDGKIDPVILGSAITSLFASFTFSRTIYKKNRGLFQSAIKSGEFASTLIAHALILYVGRGETMGPWLLFLLTINQVVYNVCRGITKSMGAKTQMVIR